MSIKQDRYREYLKSGEWKITRSRKLKQSNFKCDGCGDYGGLMEVHHLNYDRIGMELLTDLASYCINCHKIAHSKIEPSEWNKYINSKIDKQPIVKSQKDLEFEAIINSI